jgi:hypothetical protein
MTTDEIIDLGNAAEVILCNPMFNKIVDAFELSTVQAMISTKPDQSGQRELIYNKLVGAREFFAFMQEFVVERNKLIHADQPDELDQIDDQAVHDIYREQD